MAWDDSEAEDDWGERRARDVCFRLELEFTLQYSCISPGIHARLLQTVLISVRLYRKGGGAGTCAGEEEGGGRVVRRGRGRGGRG
ncbi:MAG: hypothetical protein ACPIOQ_43275 [Promethearchaeia archaeon]